MKTKYLIAAPAMLVAGQSYGATVSAPNSEAFDNETSFPVGFHWPRESNLLQPRPRMIDDDGPGSVDDTFDSTVFDKLPRIHCGSDEDGPWCTESIPATFRVTPDGHILLAGEFHGESEEEYVYVTRLNLDGTVVSPAVESNNRTFGCI